MPGRGLAAVADSIDDMGLLRHGAAGTLFAGVRAPSTHGSFLRSFTWGNVRQAEKTSREFLARLSRRAHLLPARTCWPSSTSTPHKNASPGTPSKARGSANKIQGKSLLVRA
ncbi:MAG: hypothetical protein ABSA02_35395 [Trebonia sp.]